MKYIGIDYGKKRVGVSLGDDFIRVASPFVVIENTGTDAVIEQLKKIIADEGADGVVVGIPYALSGEGGGAGAQEKETDKFISELASAIDIPIMTEDERLTSAQVGRMVSKKNLPGGRRDAVSAMLILQSYFDKLPKE